MTELLVRTTGGLQFSIHQDETEAAHWATKIGGTVEPYTPTISHKYDYLEDIT